MKLKVMASSACLLLVFLAAATTSNAESPGGKFTLPFDAQWGDAVLPAGAYRFTIVSSFGSVRYLDVRGKQASAFILPSGTENGTSAGNSHLTAVTIGGKHFVQRMEFKEGKVAFEFRLPKNVRNPADLTHLMISHAGSGS
ncbi:MAG: hypothetical protein KGM47_13630 [Acidobacteriota bacterium]|nr:hypothetical protein [Acidobacteriota bacterium]